MVGSVRGRRRSGVYANAYPESGPHYRNSGAGTARVLFVNAPGNNWRYPQETGEHGPVEDETDVERLLPILESHGVEMVGPPLDADAAKRT